MADTITGKYIEEMDETSSIDDADVFIVEGSTTQKVKWSTMVELVQGESCELDTAIVCS